MTERDEQAAFENEQYFNEGGKHHIPYYVNESGHKVPMRDVGNGDLMTTYNGPEKKERVANRTLIDRIFKEQKFSEALEALKPSILALNNVIYKLPNEKLLDMDDASESNSASYAELGPDLKLLNKFLLSATQGAGGFHNNFRIESEVGMLKNELSQVGEALDRLTSKLDPFIKKWDDIVKKAQPTPEKLDQAKDGLSKAWYNEGQAHRESHAEPENAEKQQQYETRQKETKQQLREVFIQEGATALVGALQSLQNETPKIRNLLEKSSQLAEVSSLSLAGNAQQARLVAESNKLIAPPAGRAIADSSSKPVRHLESIPGTKT